MVKGGYFTRSKSRREAAKAAEREKDFKTTDVGIDIIVGNCLNVLKD